MNVIQTLNDIELLKATNSITIERIKEIEQDFLNFYEAENVDTYLQDFLLPPWQALFVFEKSDAVLKILSDLKSLECVERGTVGEFAYYRYVLRNDYYSQIKIHDRETKEWLKEQAEWNEGIGDFSV